MKKFFRSNSPVSLLVRGFAIIVLIDLGVVGLIAGIGWWTGWTSLEEFQNAIQLAGLVIMGLGLMGIKGNLDMSRSFEYQYSMSVSQDESWERTQQTLIDLARSYSFMLIMFFAGGVCLLIGWLL